MRYSRDEYTDESANQRKISMLKRWTFAVAFIAFVTTWNPFVFALIFIISKAARKSLEDSIAINKSGIKRNRMNAVNDYLEEIFMDANAIAVGDNVYLKSDGKFINADECYLYYGEEKIGKVKELNKYSPSAYRELFEIILEMSYNGSRQTSYKEEKIQKEPVVEIKETKVTQENKTQEFIDIINGLNDDIPNEEISNGLYLTCSMLSQIAMIQDKFPETEEKIHKLYQYYLPILVEILRKYSNLQKSHHKSMQELKDAENKLNKTIILINEALKTMTSTLCQDEFMDLNANMSTLETILKSDGLVEEGTLKSVQKDRR